MRISNDRQGVVFCFDRVPRRCDIESHPVIHGDASSQISRKIPLVPKVRQRPTEHSSYGALGDDAVSNCLPKRLAPPTLPRNAHSSDLFDRRSALWGFWEI